MFKILENIFGYCKNNKINIIKFNLINNVDVMFWGIER